MSASCMGFIVCWHMRWAGLTLLGSQESCANCTPAKRATHTHTLGSGLELVAWLVRVGAGRAVVAVREANAPLSVVALDSIEPCSSTIVQISAPSGARSRMGFVEPAPLALDMTAGSRPSGGHDHLKSH